jgi:hypothetical protein
MGGERSMALRIPWLAGTDKVCDGETGDACAIRAPIRERHGGRLFNELVLKS